MMQLSLFDLMRDQPWKGAARYGFAISHPCICGRTHNGIYLSHPWGMPSLRHWRVSEPSEYTAAMMAERHAPAAHLTPTQQEARHAR